MAEEGRRKGEEKGTRRNNAVYMGHGRKGGRVGTVEGGTETPK